MGRRYQNTVSGTLSSTLAVGGNTLTANPSLQSLIAIASPDTIQITLDPEGSAGDPEVVKVTAHTASANTATIVRAQEGTTAREHLAGVAWVAAVTADALEDYETHYQARLPVGALMPYAGTTSPDTTEWLLCDGDAVSRTTYADLFAVIGTTFGVGDGSTTFNVPDLRGRIPMGLDNLGGSSANTVADANADTLGGTLGEENVALTEANLAAHDHTFSATSGTQSANHTHSHSHTHAIDHNHGAANTSTDGAHDHTSVSLVSTTGGSTSFAAGGTNHGVSHTNVLNNASTLTTIPTNGSTHAHSFNMPNFTGTSGGASTSTTGNQSASHTHSVSGTSGSAGSGTAHENMPPVLALGYLIKV